MATQRNTKKTGTTTRKTPAKTTAAEEKAEQIAAAAAPAPEAQENTTAKDAEIEALKKQLADMQRQMEAAARPQIIQMAADTEKIHLFWQAEVANDNVVTFGDGGMYGRIVGKTGTIAVPKSDLSRFLDSANRYYLDKRWLIVLDGLDEDEREMLGVNYREGELLDRRAFARMVELGDEILEIYPMLCRSHQEMVAKRYNEAFAEKSPHIKRDIVVALNRMSKAAGSEKGDFVEIIDAMNAADAE